MKRLTKLEEVTKFIQKKSGRQSVVLILKNPSDEIIEALKYYIDFVQDGGEFPNIDFNNTYTKLRIYSRLK